MQTIFKVQKQLKGRFSWVSFDFGILDVFCEFYLCTDLWKDFIQRKVFDFWLHTSLYVSVNCMSISGILKFFIKSCAFILGFPPPFWVSQSAMHQDKVVFKKLMIGSFLTYWILFKLF